MITETGRVVAVNGDQVWVQTIRQSACQSCSARQGCGQRVLAGASGGKANQVLVANTLGAKVGDEVTVAIAESALLSASLLVYALPLLLFVVGALAGQQWLPMVDAGGLGGAGGLGDVGDLGDAGAVVGSLLGLGAGFLAARRLTRRAGVGYTPELVRIQPAPNYDGNPTDS